jgi:hypothetical protein
MTQSQAPGLRLVGQIGGATYGVGVREPYAYIGVGPRLVVLDVSDLARPTPVGQSPPLNRRIHDIALVGSHAYVALGRAGMRIFDVSEPACPVEIGAWEAPRLKGLEWLGSDVAGVAVVNGLAYVADSVRGLSIVDVSDLLHPREIGSFSEPQYAMSVAVSGTLAYVCGRDSGLHIVDVADPEDPIELSLCDATAFTVVVSGNYAYLGCESDLHVVDISDPAHPEVVGAFPETASAVAVAGERAYITQFTPTEGQGLRILDVSNPVRIREIGFCSAPTWEAVSVIVAGDRAYVGAGRAGLRIVDVTDPARPVEVGGYAMIGTAGDVAVRGSHAYVVGEDSGLHIVDVADPASPSLVGSCADIRQACSVAVSGDYAYVAAREDGLCIVDVRDRARPTRVACQKTLDADDDHLVAVRHVVAADDSVYVGVHVSNKTRGVGGNYAVEFAGSCVQILDVSNPVRPRERGFHQFEGGIAGIARHGTYVYVAETRTEGPHLHVLNPDAQSQPILVGSYMTSGFIVRMAIDDDHAYLLEALASSQAVLRIVDLAEPTHPREMGVHRLDGPIYGLAAAGTCVILSVLLHGLRMLNVSNPTGVSEVATTDMPERAWGLTIAGSYLYVASSDEGLLIIEIPGGTQPDSSIAPGEPMAVPRPFLQAFQ